MARPFFRADQVGSLLRPAALHRAREQFQQGQIDAHALRAAEDQAIAELVRRQQDCGFQVVVDGEFRRENWWIDFVRGLSGVEIRDGVAAQAFVAPQPIVVITTGRLQPRRSRVGGTCPKMCSPPANCAWPRRSRWLTLPICKA